MKNEALVKRMREWVEGLKRQSDNGQHMNIPSGLSAGTCWELANELEQFIQASLEAKDEPVANNWSVFNTGAEVWDKLSLADAVVELTPSRLERGWSAVCVINKDNPPLYTTPPKQEAKDEPVSRKKPYLDKGADYEHGFIDGMQYQMQSSVDKAVNAMSQRKPLTDDEITLIIADCASSHQHTDIHLARAIEAAHGIKGEA